MSKFEIYRGNESGEETWHWRLVDSNGKNIAKSEEPFYKNSIVRSIKTIQEKIKNNTPIYLGESKEDIDKGYRFECFEEKTQWHWRLKSGNHELMTVNVSEGAGEIFFSEQDVKKALENVKVEMQRADIVFENPEDDPAYEVKQKDDTKENLTVPSGS